MNRKRKKKRGYRPPPLEEAQILSWADLYFEATGRWPIGRDRTARVPGAFNEKWQTLDLALRRGSRGLPGGSSLARLLAKHRGVRNRKGLPRLTTRKILALADSFFAEHRKWPAVDSEPQLIPGTNGDKWIGVDDALRRGLRGLPGASSLARVLSKHRGFRNIADLPPLTLARILDWADAYFKGHGRWPRQANWREAIPEAPGESWLSVHQALLKGLRGFPGGSSLAQVLSEHRGVRNKGKLPPLTENQILKWAEEFKGRQGIYPTCRCEPQEIENSGGDVWFNIDQCLRKGLRSLPGGSSLARLIARHEQMGG